MSNTSKDAKKPSEPLRGNAQPPNAASNGTPPTRKPGPNAATANGPPQKDHAVSLRELVARANNGNRNAIRHLRRFLDANPQVWQRAADIALDAEASWIELIAGTNRLVDESVRRQLAAMRDELAGPHPTRLERLLVQQITTTWLATTQADMQAASTTSVSLEQAGFRLKKAESAQKRHLNAMKLLATVRTLCGKGLAPLNPPKLYVSDQTG